MNPDNNQIISENIQMLSNTSIHQDNLEIDSIIVDRVITMRKVCLLRHKL